VQVRHRTRDLDILTEVFMRGCYEPPAALPLAEPLRILDAGANIGLFGVYALDRWEVVALTSYEPDPANAALLAATAAPHQQWNLIPKAVSSSTRPIRFITGLYSESRAARAGETGVFVSTADLFVETRDVDLLKLDIEGGEWAILTDPRLRDLDARALVMEWHRVSSPEPDAERCAARLLRNAGYTNQHRFPGPTPSNGVLWAWR
jgi:FkbM family methyltransferase